MSGKRQGRTFGLREYLKYPEGPRVGAVGEKEFSVPVPFKRCRQSMSDDMDVQNIGFHP